MPLALGPKIRWNLVRILPFGIIWLVTGLVFVFSDKLAVGDGQVPEGAIDPDGKVILFASLAVFGIGILIGILEVLIVNRLFQNVSLLQTILYKFLLYTLFFTIIIGVSYPIAASMELQTSLSDPAVWEKFRAFWGSYAYWSTALQLTFSLFLCLIYAAISEHLGHSVLMNFFMGKYHTPKQEERMFLFLDMYDSTTIAEALGHIRYFDFLQRYYNDLANAIIANRGEVYQYVGDEIVITWPMDVGIYHARSIRCFFDMKTALEAKAEKYTADFGFVPRFKGGMHLGAVTTGEVGALKKEIVYTGDVLNSAARIQGLCKEMGHEFLVSEGVYDTLKLGKDPNYQTKNLGEFALKGKHERMEVLALSRDGAGGGGV